jgi:hypothetical protein
LERTKNQDGKPVTRTRLAIPVSLRSYFFFLPFFFFAATCITSDLVWDSLHLGHADQQFLCWSRLFVEDKSIHMQSFFSHATGNGFGSKSF